MEPETNQLAIDAADETALYALNWEHFSAQFAFNSGTVTHRLRRAKRNAREKGNLINEAARFFALTKNETLVKQGGVRLTTSDDVEAYAWLWGRLIESVDGYGEELSEALKLKLKGVHKERAIDLMSVYRIEIQHDQTRETITGGTYVARAWHGPKEVEELVGDFTFDFWSETLRRKYKNSIAQRSERRGESLVQTVDPPLFSNCEVFDACILSAQGCGIRDGEIVRPASIPELREHTDDFLKFRLTVAMIQHWETVAGN